MTDYTAIVTRDEKWWMVSIPAIDGLTQARRLSEASEMAREYIAVTLDVALDEVTVIVEVDSVGGINVRDEMTAIRSERAQAAELERDATARATELAKALAKADIPLRDVGAVLGVSHQRAHQLVSS